MHSPIRILVLTLLVLPVALLGQGRQLKLDTAAGLTLHNTNASPVSLRGTPGLKLTAPPATATAADDRAGRVDHLALVDGVEFSNGTIEVDLAGEPGPGAAAGGARGFVGVAFRVQPDRKTYDCFYLRPTNGRADDQERRNHTAQYISHPAHTWFALREKTPSRYESYVDIQPATWIHVKIVVAGDKARLYVNQQEQPTLIVNDVKTGAGAKGGVALWFEGSTIAHFANLKIQPAGK
jgi:hypothetical protein